MGKTMNGNWRIIIAFIGVAGTLISVGMIYASLNGGVDANCQEIAVLKPEVRINTEYRIKSEVDTKYIKEKVRNIETMQKQILDEVRRH